MMHGREKSDSVIVAGKSPNKTGELAAEAMERRAGAEENANQQRTCRTQSRESVSPTQERVRKAARFRRHHPRWEPDAGKPHVRFCAGGAQ
jgi:RNA-directed DNA polymerase